MIYMKAHWFNLLFDYWNQYELFPNPNANQHRPHVLGISESNFFKGHDQEEVQIENYKFITAKTLENPDLNVSRVCVYLHNSMVGKVRYDLMDDTFSSIWVEVGLPN